MDWDHANIEKLIGFYRQKPELWDPKQNNYHLKTKKHDAWEQLAAQMCCDFNDVKTKMTSLLSGYRRERMKMKKSRGTAKGRGRVYRSNWFAYKHFDFLNRKDDEEMVTVTIKTENVFGEGETQPASLKQSADDTEDPEEYSNHPSPETSDPVTTRLEDRQNFASPLKPVKYVNGDHPRLAQAYSVLDSIGKEPQDECLTFSEHLTVKLRKFSGQQRTILMHNISNLVFEAEMELYRM